MASFWLTAAAATSAWLPWLAAVTCPLGNMAVRLSSSDGSVAFSSMPFV